MVSSDGTEDDLEVVELEQASRSVVVSGSGSESDPETLEVFVSKSAMIFNHTDQYTESVFSALFPYYSGRLFGPIMLKLCWHNVRRPSCRRDLS